MVINGVLSDLGVYKWEKDWHSETDRDLAGAGRVPPLPRPHTLRQVSIFFIFLYKLCMPFHQYSNITWTFMRPKWPEILLFVQIHVQADHTANKHQSSALLTLCDIKWYGRLRLSIYSGWICSYHQPSNISRTLVCNKVVDHSGVVRASPVGAAPSTSSFFS